MLNDVLKSGPGRRQGPLRPAADLCHSQDQVPGFLGVQIDLAPLHGFRVPGENIPAKLLHGSKPLGHGLDLGIVLIAAPLLQRLDQGVHFALGFRVLNGQQHAGLDVHQMRGHGDKFTGHIQIHLLALGKPLQILVADQ